MSHRDAEFGGNGNLEGDVRVQEVGEVQSIQGSLVNCLQTKSTVQPPGDSSGKDICWYAHAKMSYITQIQKVIEEDECHVLPANCL